MKKIMCATRGGDASLRTQDAVIAKAKEEGASLVFLYIVDLEFLKQTMVGVNLEVMRQEMAKMGEFLLCMACERAAKAGVEAASLLHPGPLVRGLKEAASEEGVTLLVLGRPAEESVFRLAKLEQLAAEIEQATGVETIIV